MIAPARPTLPAEPWRLHADMRHAAAPLQDGKPTLYAPQPSWPQPSWPQHVADVLPRQDDDVASARARDDSAGIPDEPAPERDPSFRLHHLPAHEQHWHLSAAGIRYFAERCERRQQHDAAAVLAALLPSLPPHRGRFCPGQRLVLRTRFVCLPMRPPCWHRIPQVTDEDRTTRTAAYGAPLLDMRPLRGLAYRQGPQRMRIDRWGNAQIMGDCHS